MRIIEETNKLHISGNNLIFGKIGRLECSYQVKPVCNSTLTTCRFDAIDDTFVCPTKTGMILDVKGDERCHLVIFDDTFKHHVR